MALRTTFNAKPVPVISRIGSAPTHIFIELAIRYARSPNLKRRQRYLFDGADSLTNGMNREIGLSRLEPIVNTPVARRTGRLLSFPQQNLTRLNLASLEMPHNYHRCSIVLPKLSQTDG